MLCKRKDIGAAVAQRGHGNRQHVHSEKQVFAKPASSDCSGQIGVRDRDDPSVDSQCFGATETFKAALLQNAQELALSGRRKRRDLVENNGAVLTEFEAAEFAFDGARKGASLM